MSVAPVVKTADPAVPHRGAGWPLVELGTLAVLIAVAIGSWGVVAASASPNRLLPPALVSALLIANILPAMALIVLVGRRIALRRAARSSVGGGGRLHVRLVATFSALAAVPVLLVTVFASLLFQYGVDFWFSDRARGMFENASAIARDTYNQMREAVADNAATMASDLRNGLGEAPIDSPQFWELLAFQTYARNLSEAAIVQVTPGRGVQTLALVNPYDRVIEDQISPAALARLQGGAPRVIEDADGRIKTLLRFADNPLLLLYVARVYEPRMIMQARRSDAVLGDYRALLSRSRQLQLQFNAALLVLSLLIVGLAVFVALRVADRLVKPVGDLVDATDRVAAGDLSARAPAPTTDDELGTLAIAFNQMTGQLEAQTTALVSVNEQSESRRALIEAVMGGVTAGVLSIGPDGTIQLVNASARTLLRIGDDGPVGRPLAEVAPELSRLLDNADREAIVQITAGGEPRTLAVKLTSGAEGTVLTFDDITQQLTDQRRAAWSDVARRIAHEIKNPLTPIQLAAERLQRRYGSKVEADDTTFARLTETIVRQVADMRRMVDEFSSFARMPKPMFHQEALLDLARQALFLHEVAHPAIRFSLDAPDPAPTLVCDRRQIGQALTNIVKNAVEAIAARPEGAAPGEVHMTVREEGATILLSVADNGIGLPPDRDRIVEPYMTTRAKGTGLGLAIVKKIVEEHLGRVSFTDRPGGGTVVTLCFEPQLLQPLAGQEADAGTHSPDPSLATLRTA